MKSVLQGIRFFIQEEALYCILLSAVILFHASSSLYISFHPIPPTPPPAEGALARAEKVLSAEPEKLQELFEKDSGLQVLGRSLSLSAAALLLFGIFLFFRFWIQQKRGEWEYRWRLLPPRPAWGLRDVFRVSVLLILIAYLIEIFQGVFFLFLKADLPEQIRLMVNTALLDLAALALILYWVSMQKGQSLRGLGFSAKHFSHHIFFAVSSYVALLPALAMSLFVSIWVSDRIRFEAPQQPLYEIFFGDAYQEILWVTILMVVLIGPIVEEAFFRGFLYSALKTKWGKRWAMVTSGIFFALLHANWVGFLPIALLGITLAFDYEVTGTLVASIALHSVHNTLVMGFVFLMRDLLKRVAGG